VSAKSASMVYHRPLLFGSSIYFSTVVLSAALGTFRSSMNYRSRRNVALLKERLTVELPRRNLYVPLCLPSEVPHESMIQIWELINMAPNDFERFVRAHPDLWVHDSTMRWHSVLSNWGLSDTVIAHAKFENHGSKFVGEEKKKAKLKWVNFLCDGSLSITSCAQGEPRSCFRLSGSFQLPSARNPCGFEFCLDIPEQSFDSERSEPHAKRKKVARIATPRNLLTPLEEAASRPLDDVLAERPSSSFSSVPVEPSVIDEEILSKIEAGEYKMNNKEKALLFRLMTCMQERPVDCKYVQTVTFKKDENHLRREVAFLRLQAPTKEDASAKKHSQYKRGQMVSWYINQVGAGVNSLSRGMKKNAAVFSAARIKSGVTKTPLDVHQSLRIQSALGLSNTGFRRLKQELKTAGAAVTLASQGSMRKAVSKNAVECCYYQDVVLEGSKSGELKCLIFAANICDLVSRDLGNLFTKGDFKIWPFKHNEGILYHL